MSAFGLSVRIHVVDRASSQLAALWWHLWWHEWGTDGARRRRALVVVS